MAVRRALAGKDVRSTNIYKLLKSLDRLPSAVQMGLGILLALLVGLLDIATGYEISISFLYLLPILMLAWLRGGGPAAFLAIICTLIWLSADVIAGHQYSHVAITIWNAFMGLGVFLITGYAFAAIRKLLLQEHEHAHTDFLTGVANARSFYEQSRMELERLARYGRPLTVAYVDVDNFKGVNDTLGHSAGDKVLRDVAQMIKSTTRSVDFVARLGGDEFAVLMPETNAVQADTAVRKVQERLQHMVKEAGWPVSFSIGIVTCSDPSCSIDDLIKTADEVMYEAKKGGKNTARFKAIGRPAA